MEPLHHNVTQATCPEIQDAEYIAQLIERRCASAFLVPDAYDRPDHLLGIVLQGSPRVGTMYYGAAMNIILFDDATVAAEVCNETGGYVVEKTLRVWRNVCADRSMGMWVALVGKSTARRLCLPLLTREIMDQALAENPF